jgi:hypothetical protein
MRPNIDSIRSGMQSNLQERVLGEVWSFTTPQTPAVLRTLAQIEGTNQPGFANLYDRVITAVFGLNDQPLGDAWAYHYAKTPGHDGFYQIVAAELDHLAVWSTADWHP